MDVRPYFDKYTNLYTASQFATHHTRTISDKKSVLNFIHIISNFKISTESTHPFQAKDLKMEVLLLKC